MFDLVAGTVAHVPNKPTMPILISSVVESIGLAIIAVVSLMAASGTIPSISPMAAFVAQMPAAIPPPPPPPPPNQPRAATMPTPVVSAAAPIEAPASIEPEPPTIADAGGVPDGVEGGVVGGVVGGIPALVEGPPPPPSPPAAPQIRRIGGDLRAPALIHRVEPVYPLFAQYSHVAGIVLLDAIVDANGFVQTVTVIKGHALLAAAAVDAVKQWQYAPLLLNGNSTPFELTVTLVFHLSEDAG